MLGAELEAYCRWPGTLTLLRAAEEELIKNKVRQLFSDNMQPGCVHDCRSVQGRLGLSSITLSLVMLSNTPGDLLFDM